MAKSLEESSISEHSEVREINGETVETVILGAGRLGTSLKRRVNESGRRIRCQG